MSPPTQPTKSKIPGPRVSVTCADRLGRIEVRRGRIVREQVNGYRVHLFPTLTDLEPTARDFPACSVELLP